MRRALRRLCMIDLQAMAPDDWAEWRALRLRALTDAPGALGATLADWRDASEVRWRARLSMPGSRNLIARCEGRAVGMASGIPGAERDVAGLITMWVAPEMRGMGVADALVAALAEWARDRGAHTLELEVVDSNARAIACYRRLDFVDAGAAREIGERRMVKVLGDLARA